MTLTKKNKLIDPKQKSHILMGKTPVWLSMLKLGSTGLILSFLTALFLFIAQIMIVNFLPQTQAFDFYNLFIYHQHIFNQLIQQGKINEQSIIAVADSTGLGFFNTSSIARSAISLVSGELFLVQIFPSVIIAGGTFYYAKALGTGEFGKAKEAYQNSIISVSLVALSGFILMIVLTPLLTPVQAVESGLNVAKIDELNSEIINHLNNLGVSQDYFQNNFLIIHEFNGSFYLAVLKGKAVYFLDISHENVLSSTSLLQNAKIATSSVIEVNLNHLLSTWQTYFSTVRAYSIKWAEQFLWIMSLALVTQCYGGLIAGLVRTDGELKWTTIVSVIGTLMCALLNYLLIVYGQLGLVGSAIASVLAFFIQLVCYVLLLQYHPDSRLKLKDLRHMKAQWRLVGKITLRGANKILSSVGNMILLILLTNQLTYVSNALLATSGSEYFISILGGVIPFISLFSSTLNGSTKNVIQVFSYNYAQKNYKRFYECYWFTFLYGLITGLIIFFLFGLCEPIKVGVLSWFHVTSSNPNQELNSSLKLMMIWMIEIPCLAFMLDSAIIFIVMGKIPLAFLNSAFRTILIPIPILYIFSSVAVNHAAGFGTSILPYDNNAMWFFIDVGPVYTACFCGVVFIFSTAYIYTHLNKNIINSKKIKVIKVIQ